jgi:hypothetical protein
VDEDICVGFAGKSVNFPDIEDDENARDAELPPTRRASVESVCNVDRNLHVVESAIFLGARKSRAEMSTKRGCNILICSENDQNKNELELKITQIVYCLCSAGS